MKNMDPRIPVAMEHCADYAPQAVLRAVRECLRAADIVFPHGARVLVKPNLLKATPDGLACTHPQVVRAVCACVKEQGGRPFVADSPGFGSGRKVARRIGLTALLEADAVPVRDLGRAVRRKLPMGHSIGVSRLALEADMICNVSKLKAHCQMRVTGAVKNLFGCVPGTRKAIAHTVHGDMHSPRGPRFESLIIELAGLLPPTVSLMDGVRAMHVRGPSGGSAFALGLLAASPSAVALDTAVYALLGLAPGDVPLWRECIRRALPGAVMDDVRFPLRPITDFDAASLQLPERLDPMTFHPVRLGISALRRALARIS